MQQQAMSPGLELSRCLYEDVVAPVMSREFPDVAYSAARLDDLWRALLAAQWKRVAEQESFVARCGDVGDELGSRLIAARQVRELMLVVFLLKRVYPPYPKWLGTAFQQLPTTETIRSAFARVLEAPDWYSREQTLNTASVQVGKLHNATGLTAPVDLSVRKYYNRPYKVLDAGRFVSALEGTYATEIGAPGAAWQWADTAEIDESPVRALAAVQSQRPHADPPH